MLLFLHADTVPPPVTFERIAEAMRDEDCAGGAFDLRIDSPQAAFRIIETFANLRSRLTRIPYGDQAIFIRASCFRTLGGFREIPIMEDVDRYATRKERRFIQPSPFFPDGGDVGSFRRL